MQAKDTWVREKRDLVDFHFNQLLRYSFLGNSVLEVGFGEEELLIAIEDEVS